MKHGKLPTLSQKKIMKAHGLDLDKWLVVKNLSDRLEIVSRIELKKADCKCSKTRTITKEL